MYKKSIKSMLESGNTLRRTESPMDFQNTPALCVGISSFFFLIVLHRILSSDPNIFAQFGLTCTCAEKYH